jgi:P27 family predicted phage terminase small subunit
MKGRRPTPDVLKIANGTLRKGRQKKRPAATGKIPKCPFERGTIAAKKWQEVVTGLKHFQLVDKIDATHIEGLCVAYEQAKQADAKVSEEGMYLTGARGTLIKHPCVQIAAEAWKLVRAYCNDLGLNHLSRQRMAAKQDTPDETVNIEARYFG